MDFSTYKAFLFDVDKTLTNSKKETTQTTVAALKKLARAGFLTGVCTGRNLSTLSNTLTQLFPSDALHVVSGGAEVIQTNGKRMWQRTVREDATRDIMSLAKKLDMNCVVCYNDTLYTDTFTHGYSLVNAQPPIVKTLSELPEFSVPIITIYKTDERLYSELSKMDDVSFKKMISYKEVPYVDITAKGVNKSVGIQEWCRILGQRPEEIIGFGDSENDLEFLQSVGYAVAMGNATDAVKAIADEVTDDCDHDGIATWIEKNLK